MQVGVIDTQNGHHTKLYAFLKNCVVAANHRLVTLDSTQNTPYFSAVQSVISRSDVIISIADSTDPTIGFITQHILQLPKPLILVPTSNSTSMRQFLTSLQSVYLQSVQLTEHSDPAILQEALRQASNLGEKRLHIRLPAHVHSYLEGQCQRSGTSKASFIRQLLLAHKAQNEHND